MLTVDYGRKRGYMDIRPALESDSAGVASLRDERTGLLRQSDPRTPAPSVPVATLLESAVVLVAVVDARLVGYIAAWVGETPYGVLPADAALIDEIALDAHQYHGGLGRRLLTTVRQTLAADGIESVWVAVPQYRAVEQAFWRAAGASVVAASPFEPRPATVWMQLGSGA